MTPREELIQALLNNADISAEARAILESIIPADDSTDN